MLRLAIFRLSALLLVITLCATLATTASAAPRTYDVTVRAGDHDRVQSPAKATFDVPLWKADNRAVTLVDADGRKIPAQITLPIFNNEAKSTPGPFQLELHFIVPELAANAEWKLTATIDDEPVGAPDANQFSWHDQAGISSELRFSDRPVMRYMYAALDESTPERRAETYKPYHHVFSPDGSTLLTKGPGGLFPHHRGLFYGFNRISYGDKKADTWHCTNGAYQSHESFLPSETGPVLGCQTVLIDWHGQDAKPFAREAREMTAYSLPDGTLIDFTSRLSSLDGEVKLDGDPQHAGFQFRAAQEVAESTNKQTYYLRPQGKGAPGETLNWPEAPEMVNLPWHAMSCVIGGKRFTVAMLDHPRNPKESRFSERDYGRFGSYFEYTVTPEKPLDLNYRVWVTEGETTPEAIEAKVRDFASPVEVVVTPR